MAALTPITRDVLAKFLPDNDTIRRFEQLFQIVGTTNPQNLEIIFTLIQETQIAAANSGAVATQASDSISSLEQVLTLMALTPPATEPPPQDNLLPPVQIGTLGEQQADRARITGGTANDLVIGGTTPAAATATVLTSTGQTVVGTLLDLSAAGSGQIQFPATQNPSANANTLDDYEEGTWVPVLTCSTPGNLVVTYSVQAAAYTKIGRMVHVNFVISTSAFTWTTSSGGLIVSGLPFANAAVSQIAGHLDWSGITKIGYTSVSATIGNGLSVVTFAASGSGLGRAGVNIADLPTGGSVFLSGQISYFV